MVSRTPDPPASSAPDQLTRLLYGARVSISLGFVVAGVSMAIGTALGLLAGYHGGWVDDLVNATIQVQHGVPFLYLLIMYAMVFPPTLWSLAVHSGCREGELLGLRWDDVDLTTRTIRIHRTLLGCKGGVPEYGERVRLD